MRHTRTSMPETMYRASRCCRVLGNPTAYLVLSSLGAKRKTPGDLSRDLSIPLPTISRTLRHLRQVDLVRYEITGSDTMYWVKGPGVRRILRSVEDWVESVRDAEY